MDGPPARQAHDPLVVPAHSGDMFLEQVPRDLMASSYGPAKVRKRVLMWTLVLALLGVGSSVSAAIGFA